VAIVLSSSDQPGVLLVDQSIDGVNIARSDGLNTAVDLIGNNSSLMVIYIGARYIRVRYINLGSSQGTLTVSLRFQGC